MFPEETEYVIRQLSHVYRVDAEARRKGLSPQKRLALHRAKRAEFDRPFRAWMVGHSCSQGGAFSGYAALALPWAFMALPLRGELWYLGILVNSTAGRCKGILANSTAGRCKGILANSTTGRCMRVSGN
ncbi:MAG: hypothetical protein KatS3mg111_0113 [Pirellulaceae bacterium]|nr:MAG: hypothetical protein KatS3mg111_0113 [Pirellulaceae bacterium]